jgi:Gluconate 2-dehydrogenase subunit 3
MKRRQFIALLGFCSMGGAAALWGHLSSFWRPRFSKHAVQVVTAVADLMFPGDGLPGAKELGIPNRIVAMSNLHALIADGAAWLDGQAAHQGAADFLALDEAGRLAAVEAAFASKDDAGRRFVYTLRLHAGQFYYTEPVIKAAFPYTGPPQPNGFPDFQDPPQ